MGTRQRIRVLILLALIATGAVFLLTHSSDPEYQGRKLSSWLVEFDHWDGVDTNAPVVLAIRAMGVQAVPILVENCLATDSPLKRRVSEEFEKHPASMKYRYTTAVEKWSRGASGLRVIGHDARAACPAFLAALTNEDVMVRRGAVSALGEMGPEAEDCLPALIARYDDATVRGNLMHAFEFIGRRPDLCVPVLLKGLEDADPTVRAIAVHALGSFGEQARVAIPALTKALSDKATARDAAKALKKIQP